MDLDRARDFVRDHWDEYRVGMEEERRVLLRITPTKAGPDRQG